MVTKAILLLLILMLSASCLCIGTPVPPEELVEKYETIELVIGFLVVSVGMATPLWASVFLFKKIW